MYFYVDQFDMCFAKLAYEDDEEICLELFPPQTGNTPRPMMFHVVPRENIDKMVENVNFPGGHKATEISVKDCSWKLHRYLVEMKCAIDLSHDLYTEHFLIVSVIPLNTQEQVYSMWGALFQDMFQVSQFIRYEEI